MNEPDEVRLRHMLDAAKKAQEFIQGETRDSLDTDDKLAFALVRAIEIIGEAASRMSPEFREAHPLIPWTAIVGMRNRLIHGYFDISLSRLWDTATTAIPPLIDEIEKILQPRDIDPT